nr:putative ribonuclease H-like domain-containing protein [Tanacetum cinerariifolium]
MQFHHHTGLFPPPKLNLSYTGLEELFNEPKTKKLKDKSNDVEPESVKKDSDASIIEDWVSDDEEENVEKKKVKPSIHRINFVKYATDNNPRETVKNGKQPKQNTHRKRGNQRNWNGMMSHRVPRQNNMYNIDLKNIVPIIGLTCLFAKATKDESKLWHRRLAHLKFKTINKLIKGNILKGFPSKIFKNDQSCVACQKGKQYKASCKARVENSISTPLHLLHMDLFGPTFIKSLNKKMYFLVVTDYYSKFTWVFFLGTKDETSGLIKSFIIRVENLMNLRVKVIRCDNRTEFKNIEMNQFCKVKGVMRQYSVARTPQQNRVAERRNKTLIDAARTMLADLKLPTTFWDEAVNTACYV